MRPFLVIDGYNLMHAGGLARRTYAAGQLDRCRRQLLRYLARRLSALERARTTIVFDAREAPTDLSRQTVFEEMTVCFAPHGKEADDFIEEWVAGHSSPRQIRLVSSDHRLQRCVRRRRGTFVDSEAFFDELERRGDESSDLEAGGEATFRRGDTKETGSADDSEYWLRIFGHEAGLPGAGDSERSIDQSDVPAIEREVNQQEFEPRSGPGTRRSGKNS